MRLNKITLVIYGMILITAGFWGLSQAHSYVSLVMGTISGGLILFCSWQLNTFKLWPYYAAVALTVFLMGVFALRFVKTMHFMPAGLMMLFSSIVLSILLQDVKKIFFTNKTAK